MIQVSGDENSKLSQDIQRTCGKSVPPKLLPTVKAVPEKTKFTLQYNTVNNQCEKSIDKKEFKSLIPKASRIVRSTKTNLPNAGMQDVRVKSIRDPKSVQKDPKLSQLNNERKISSSSLLTSVVNKKSSVASTRRSIKTPVTSKSPSDSKSGLLPPKRNSGLHVQMCSSLNCKTEIKTYGGKIENSKKTLICSSGMKLKESGKFTRNINPNLKKVVSGCKPPENHIIKETKEIKDKTPERSRRNYVFDEGKMMVKLRSRSQEVKRITDENNSVKMNEVAQRKRSDYNLDRKKSCSTFLELIKKDWETANMKLDKQKKTLLNGTSLNQSNNHIEENLTLGDAYNQNDLKNKKINSSSTNNENKFLQNYPLNVTEPYNNLESREHRQCDEEFLNSDKRAWSNLEIQIKETCEKTDFLDDSGDDSAESITDLIQQLLSNRENDLVEDIKTCESHKYSDNREELNSLNMEKDKLSQEKWNSFSKKLILQTESRKNFYEKSKSWKGIEETNNKKNQESKRIKSSEDSKIRINKHHFRTKSLTRNIKCTNSIENSNGTTLKERKTVNFQENQNATKTVSSSFFHDHQNIGFIGKDVDEDFVSFEPGQVTLYQPYENQMLLYDIANCVATQGYLNMCNITYNVIMKKNAEQMSPSGRVPFISSNLCIIPEFEAIVSFMQYKKFSCIPINESSKSAFRANISMIKNVLEKAERYICWYDSTTLLNYTRPRITGQYPFPLNYIMHWKKRYEERCRLTERGYMRKSLKVILDEINSCFQTLSLCLGSNTFFFGRVGTEVDALVYGHIYALFTTEVDGPLRDIQFMIQQYPNLISFACNFDKMFCLNKFSNIKKTYWDNISTNNGGYSNSPSFTVKV